jgi:hypothetical protein
MHKIYLTHLQVPRMYYDGSLQSNEVLLIFRNLNQDGKNVVLLLEECLAVNGTVIIFSSTCVYVTAEPHFIRFKTKT